MPKWWRALSALGLAALTACGTHTVRVHPDTTHPVDEPGQSTAAPPANVTAGVPGLDGLASLGASPSKWISKNASSIDGVAVAAQGGARNRAEGSALAIIPGAQDELGFAMYTQAGISFDKPASVDFTVEPTAIIPGAQDELPLQFWIGVSDYTTYKWKWFGPFDGSNVSSVKGARVVRKGTSSLFSLSVNNADDVDRYVSAPNGANQCQMSYVVVCTATGDPDRPHAVKVDVSNTNVSSDYLANNPHFVPVFEPDVVQSVDYHRHASAASHSVDISWEHIPSLGPADDQNTAAVYQILRQGSNETAPVKIDTVNAPQTDYTDPPASGYPSATPPIKPPTPGVRYTYFVRAINPEQGGTPKAPTSPAIYPIDPPDQLRTTLAADNTTVNVTWNPVDGAKSYKVSYYYASDPSNVTLLADNVATPSIAAVPDSSGDLIYYCVTANGLDAKSSDSDGTRAFRPDYTDAQSGGTAFTLKLDASNPATFIRFLKVPGSSTGSDLQLGSDNNEWGHATTEEPNQDVVMGDFYIGETEVTNAQWAAFMNASTPGYQRDAGIWTADGVAWRNSHNITEPPFWSTQEHNSGIQNPNYPVVDVSWFEANAFANWVNEKAANSGYNFNLHVSLPNEAQWEWAAEGPTSGSAFWLYPWAEMREFNGGIFNDGDDGQDQQLCNNATSHLPGDTCDVFGFPDGRSWCGAYNMAGNVAEWTSDIWRDSYPDPWFADSFDGSNSSQQIVARGGRMLDSCIEVRNSARQSFANDFRLTEGAGGGFEGVGLRLVLTAVPQA